MLGIILTAVIIVAVLVGCNALFVAAEFSAISARRTRLIQLAESGNRLARMLIPILEDTHKLDRYIAASQVGITLSSIVLGIYGQQKIAPLIVPLISRVPAGATEAGEAATALGTAAFLTLIVLTTLQVVFGELLPKSIAIQYPEQVALATTIPARWSADIFFRPLIWVLNGSGNLFLKFLGIQYGGEHTHIHSPEEIVILVKESHEGGLLDREERYLLRNVFRVRKVVAGEIAVPRTRMVAIAADRSVSDAVRVAAESAFSRIPVYEGDIDHIIGFVHLYDLFRLYHENPESALQSIIRPIPFVPESLSAISVWERMNETESYLVVVVDEFGGTLGLITREDMIEELFGEVQDEFDQERALISTRGDGRLVVRGDMSVSYLNELLGIDLPHEMSYSIGGLVQDELGRLPQIGDTVDVSGVRLHVEGISERVITSLSVMLPPGVDLPPPEDIT